MSSNHIAIVLDRSGSMSMLWTSAVKAYNDTINTIRAQSRAKGIPTYVTLVSFGDTVRMDYKGLPIEEVPVLSAAWENLGMTALMDATSEAIHHLSYPWYGAVGFNHPLLDNEDARLVIVISDGEENKSRNINKLKFKTLIDSINAKDNWSLAFQLPRQYVNRFSDTFGVSLDNIQPWDLTQQGTETASQGTQSAVQNYYAVRSTGAKSVKTFYKDITTNAPQILPSQLQDATYAFKEFEVKEEAPIKDFLEKKTRKAYVIGSGYYQLMKSEKVQPTKRVLLVDKTTKRIYGGPSARKAIGLDSTPAKVTPGNHGNYEIYVQSASPNRKLPRGTKVLFDTTLTVGVAPTWGI